MIFVIEGSPIPQKRHRHSNRNGFVRVYDPSQSDKENIRKKLIEIISHYGNSKDSEIGKEIHQIAFADAFEVEFIFLIDAPKTKKTTRGRSSIWVGDATGKPDLDNLEKLYLDAATGIFWKDDKQIISLKSSKRYSENPRTIMKVVAKKQMSIDENTSRILSLFTPTRFKTLFEDIRILCQNEKISLEALEMDNQEHSQLVAQRCANILSKIADSCGKELALIAKKYPNHWRKNVSQID